MLCFNAVVKKFGQQGEKTGWTYIDVPAKLAGQLKPNNKKSFRVKGFLDDHAINGVALVPMGGGDFIIAVNATMRKQLRKSVGSTLSVKIEVDEKVILPPAELIECLNDEPKALEHYNRLPKSHQLYFTRWIESAKTDVTKAKRIALSVTALASGLEIGDAMRMVKSERTKLLNG